MTLEELGSRHGTDKASGCHDYLIHYDAMFGDKRHSFKAMLEIGVLRGNSIRMWVEWMPNARVVGVDKWAIHDPCLVAGAFIETADAADGLAMRQIGMKYGPFDLIVDDGSHDIVEQQCAMDALLQFVRPGGYYIIEDITIGDDRFPQMNRVPGKAGCCFAYLVKE